MSFIESNRIEFSVIEDKVDGVRQISEIDLTIPAGFPVGMGICENHYLLSLPEANALLVELKQCLEKAVMINNSQIKVIEK